MTLSERTSENRGYLQCLSDLQDFIERASENEYPLTAREIGNFFIISKLAECNKILEVLQDQLNNLKKQTNHINQ